jgi:SAM-dependent MidA family methyltransferase
MASNTSLAITTPEKFFGSLFNQTTLSINSGRALLIVSCEKGDFITAPETSDLFGFCLAQQCAQVLENGGSILEFGAGSGILAAQILFESEVSGAVIKSPFSPNF